MYQGKNPAKNTGFSPRYSAPKRHSSLFLRTFLCRNTHVPPPPGPGPHPGPACHPGPARSSPLRPSGPAPPFPSPGRRRRPGRRRAPLRRRARCRCRRGQPECWRGLARRPSPTNKRRRERAALLLVPGRSAAPPAKPPPSPCSLARRAWASHGPSRAPVSTPRRQGAFSAAPSRLQSTATVDPNSFPHAVERAAGAPTPTASVVANREGRCALRLFAPLGAPFSVPSAAAGAPRAGSGAPTRRSASKSLRYAAPQLVKEACKSCS